LKRIAFGSEFQFSSSFELLQRSDTGPSNFRSAFSIAAVGNQEPTVGCVATISSNRAPGSDQKRVLLGGSFRVAENLFLPGRHNASAQLAAFYLQY
jgi:hypothetical protein